ncbi:hypothetical protein MTO96_038458, partial [Rhipicephalus appendiculatus]
ESQKLPQHKGRLLEGDTEEGHGQGRVHVLLLSSLVGGLGLLCSIVVLGVLLSTTVQRPEGDAITGLIAAHWLPCCDRSLTSAFDPCKDFYKYVCNTVRGSDEFWKVRDNIEATIIKTLSDPLNPSSSPLSVQKAAALFQACVHFTSQYRYETYHLIEWMLSLNLDLFNETRLATVNPFEMMMRGSLDLGVQAVITVVFSGSQFVHSKRKVWIGHSNEPQEWYATNRTVTYYELLLRDFGAKQPDVNRLATKLYGYDMQLKNIAQAALAAGGVRKFVRIRDLGSYTKPYVTEDEWATFFAKYTNGTYTGTDVIIHLPETTTLLTSLFKSKSVGKDGLRYLVAWIFYRQVVMYTYPEMLRNYGSATTACFELTKKVMNLAVLSSYFASALPPRMVYQTKRMASRIRNAFESAFNSSTWIGRDVRDEFINRVINLKFHVGLTGRRSDPAFVEEIYRDYPKAPRKPFFPYMDEGSVAFLSLRVDRP